MELKDNLPLAHSQVIVSRTSRGSEPVIFARIQNHARETDKDSVGGANMVGFCVRNTDSLMWWIDCLAYRCYMYAMLGENEEYVVQWTDVYTIKFAWWNSNWNPRK